MSNEPNKKSNHPKDDSQEETLAERSSRLEQEIQSGLYGSSADDDLFPNSDMEDEETQSSTPSADDPTLLNAQIEALHAELNKTKEQLLRSVAETENIRKRSVREREDASKYGIVSFAKNLTSVADNLRRALESVPQDLIEREAHIKNLIEGIEATERSLLTAFEKNHIKKMECKGQPFDPNFHEAMFETPGTGQPAGTIIEVIETGYTIHDRVLRPARVGVAKGEKNGESKGPTSPGSQIDMDA